MICLAANRTLCHLAGEVLNSFEDSAHRSRRGGRLNSVQCHVAPVSSSESSSIFAAFEVCWRIPRFLSPAESVIDVPATFHLIRHASGQVLGFPVYARTVCDAVLSVLPAQQLMCNAWFRGCFRACCSRLLRTAFPKLRPYLFKLLR